MMPTSISWTDETWNPITGCSRVSDGCRNCYAERLSLKNGWSKKPWTAQNAAENVVLHPERLNKPTTWKKPCMVFVNSMSDLFHDLVPGPFIDLVMNVIRDCPQHIFQILTKRPARALSWDFPDNVWFGTSVENARVTYRIATLRHITARVRFVSFEPLIGPVGDISLAGIDWAIVGGESGPDFRPMDHVWARAIHDICARDGVAFYFKQSASKRPGSSPFLLEADGTKTEWRQWPGEKVERLKVQVVDSEPMYVQGELWNN
jgi:protein gp37